MQLDTGKNTAEVDLGPRSPLRTVQVLHELAKAGTGVPLATLANRLEFPKTTLFRLLRSLEHGGYVVSVNGVHHVGPEALKLGSALVRNREFPDCARSIMDWLATETGETIILGTMSADKQDVVYSVVIEASHPLRFSIKVGTTHSLYSSANGLVLLGFMPGEMLKTYLSQLQFVKLTQKTINSERTLMGRLREIRKLGYSLSDGGMFDGVHSIAAPVIDGNGCVQAGISISTPSARGLEREDAFIELIKRAGEEVSRILGYTGVYPPSYPPDRSDK